jgi:hypothetical protein
MSGHFDEKHGEQARRVDGGEKMRGQIAAIIAGHR